MRGQGAADVLVVGGGPAGMAAAVECASRGASVLLVDENLLPGGQLFKQIHKFFGSYEHYAGKRGTEIGQLLLAKCRESAVKIALETVAYGVFAGCEVGLSTRNTVSRVRPRFLILATGASENALCFQGWTLPGVMGAGAAQTLMHVHRVLPGKRVLMVGSGNVGLLVAYQFLQAGAEVVAVVDVAPSIGGYAVHAAKLVRAGVPILLEHSVVSCSGAEAVEKATIARVGAGGEFVPGSEIELRADVVCLAVGLSPSIELATMAGCKIQYVELLGGNVPVHDSCLRTTNPQVFVAGDCSGVQEASTALEEGRLAGISVSESLGLVCVTEAQELRQQVNQRLAELRSGPFGEAKGKAKLSLMAQC